MKIKENIHLLRIDFNIRLSPEKLLPRFVNVLVIIDSYFLKPEV